MTSPKPIRKIKKADRTSNSETFCLLFANHPIPMWIYDLKTLAFLEVNDAALEKYGYSRDEFLGLTIKDIRPAEDVARLIDNLEQKRTALHHSGAWRHCLKNGQLIDVEITTHTLDFEGHKAALVIAQDITERKQMEETLRESEDKFKYFFEHSTVGKSITLPSGEMNANQALCDMFGYTQEELQNKKWREITHPDDIELTQKEIDQLLSGVQSSARFDKRYIHKNGSVVWVDLSSSLRRDQNGEPLYLMSSIIDITEHKQSEDKLRESEERFHLMFEKHDAIMLLIEPQTGLILDANQAATKFYGYTKPKLCEMSINEINTLPPEQVAAERQKALHEERNYFVFSHRLANGEERTVEVHSSPISFQEKQVLFSIVHDITERKQAEEKLREREQTLHSFIANSPDTMYLLDLENHTSKYLNCEEFCGYPKSVLESPASIMFALHPDDGPTVQANWQQTLHASDDDVTSCEYRLQRKDGNWEWIQQRMTILSRTVDRKPSQVLVTLSIITERKQAEEKIIVSEARYRRLFEAAKDGILILDAETGVIVDVNPFLCDMLGFSHEEICGKELWEMGFFKDIAENKANFLELQEKGYIRYDDLPLEIANGRKFHVEFVSNVYQMNHHKVIQCNIRDITERKQMENVLRASEKNYRELIDGMHDTVWIIDFDGNLIDVNRTAVEVTGYSKEDLLAIGIYGIDSSLKKEDIKALAKAMPSDKVQIFETNHKTRDGRSFPVEVSSSLVTYYGKHAILSIARDITERKQAEDVLKEYNTRLETVVEARTNELREAQEKLMRNEKLAVLGQLAGSVGHELRNPLAVINNALYYLKLIGADSSEKVKEYLGIIQTETHTAEKIITDLLDFARIKSVDMEPVSVSKLVARVFERYPAPKAVNVRLEIPENLAMLYADPRQMEQVFGNLVINACQAMSAGGELTITARQEQEMIAIAVKDTGVGISPENMKKLFEPLFTTKAKGIGLGLAVSQKLAEANGGRIEVESEAGVGSTFTVYLPVKQ